ncbi:MAG TPA: division/cell wall cluster transcriptional repressor MraZ [Patescibacteria group bacterium]|nr:division/cell wall cluster transcriptional repressor MraZ [Patescibacteria group bacterium]
MLIGQYEGKIDEKGRISLPKKFREILGDEIIITHGFENSLTVVARPEWENLLEGTRGRPFIEYETRETQRFLLGGASEVKSDSKGRFILPSYLRTFAGIESNIIFLGLSRYVEIWDLGRWEKYKANLSGKIEGISARLAEKENKK